MAKKRKKRGAAADDEAPALAKVPDKLASPFRDALRGVKAVEPATSARAAARSRASPPKTLGEKKKAGDDRHALSMAYSGVARLGGRARRVTGLETATRGPDGSQGRAIASDGSAIERDRSLSLDADAAARARLGALVGGGVRIQVSRDEDGRVLGQRTGADASIVRRIARGELEPDATLDLHGSRAADAEARVVRFVRTEHRRGARAVLVVHGKGTHSESGVAVLDDVALRALTEGGAAPLVLALATAPARLGGSGALLVRLVDRI